LKHSELARKGKWPTNQKEVKNEVICLVGSVRQEKDWRYWIARLTAEGYIVFGAGLYQTIDEGVSQETWGLVSKVHLKKIDLSDIVAIIRKEDGSIGDDTRSDVEYARSMGKRVVNVEDLLGDSVVS